MIYSDPHSQGGRRIGLFVGNNPIDGIDPLGLWPTSIHDQIAENSFHGTLEGWQISVIKNSSAAVDSVLSGGQSEAGAYMHMMRAPDQPVAEAVGLTRDFITQHTALAREYQESWESAGGLGYAPAALDQYGNVFHAVTHGTSPEHEGYQVWDPWDLNAVGYHIFGEENIKPEQMERAVKKAIDYFNMVFKKKSKWQ